MFQNRRQATLGNINLGTLSAPPSYEDMTFLLEQASKYRGRFVEISWAVPKTGATFQLTAKYLINQPLPVWMLYRGVGGTSELIWGHNSNDLTLMHNLVMLECEKPVEGGGNSISADAMDGMIASNKTAGAVAGPQQQSAVPGQVSNPTNTWLQNLSFQAPGETTPAVPDDTGTAAAAAEAQSTPESTADTRVDQGQPQETPHELTPHETPHELTPHEMPPASYTPVPVESSEERPISMPAAEAQSPPQQGSVPTELLLDGSLSNIAVPKLFHYLAQNGLTGRLSIQSGIGAAEIFFKAGNLIHAATLEGKGENAMLDVATWLDGEFHFQTDDQTSQTTLSGSPRELVSACERMLSYQQYLASQGLTPASYLVRMSSNVGRSEFEQAVQRGAQIDLYQQWRVYERVDGNRTLFDVMRLTPMERAEWIPILYNLVRSGLVGVSNRPATIRPGMFLEGQPIDQSAIDEFMALSSDLSDDVLNRGAFLFLLQQEYFRHERTGSRFALAIFSVATTNLLDGNVVPLSTEAMKVAAGRINAMKRKLDMLGHWDGSDFALLLPETDAAGAAVFANRIARGLKKPTLTPDLEGKLLVFSFGIAGLPDDVRDLPALVAAARAAKSRSKMMGSPIVCYAEAAG